MNPIVLADRNAVQRSFQDIAQPALARLQGHFGSLALGNVLDDPDELVELLRAAGLKIGLFVHPAHRPVRADDAMFADIRKAFLQRVVQPGEQPLAVVPMNSP
jgi:hypothetical protein